MNIVTLIISLVSGAVGGNAAGAAMKDKSLELLQSLPAHPRCLRNLLLSLAGPLSPLTKYLKLCTISHTKAIGPACVCPRAAVLFSDSERRGNLPKIVRQSSRYSLGLPANRSIFARTRPFATAKHSDALHRRPVLLRTPAIVE